MTWPASCLGPWNPPTSRCGSANATEAGSRRRRPCPVGAASPTQALQDQRQPKPPSPTSNKVRLYYPVNGHLPDLLLRELNTHPEALWILQQVYFAESFS